MKVTVVGAAGYVGLVTSACLPEMGDHLVCLDVDTQKICVLDTDGIAIHEPGLLEWKEFRTPDLPALKAALCTPLIFDGRNPVRPMAGHGIEYHGIGRPIISAEAAWSLDGHAVGRHCLTPSACI